MQLRLNKYLSKCGLGSRRKVEELIVKGQIYVNDKKTTEFSTEIDTETDKVSYKNEVLKLIDHEYFLILNKPKGYITTLSDEKNRATVMDLIPEKYKRAGVVPVGRLDKDTEGLLLLTNNGDMSQKLNKPTSHVIKEYYVELDKELDDKAKLKIEKGIFLHQIKVKTAPCKIKFTAKSRKFLTIAISEGKKRQIRYTFKKFGLNVEKLRRVSYGPLKITGVNKGDHRVLKSGEVKKLLEHILNQK